VLLECVVQPFHSLVLTSFFLCVVCRAALEIDAEAQASLRQLLGPAVLSELEALRRDDSTKVQFGGDTPLMSLAMAMFVNCFLRPLCRYSSFVRVRATAFCRRWCLSLAFVVTCFS
jgi:hypothetical protein